MMSRKQELYLMLLASGLVFIRNYQSQNNLGPWWRIRFWKRRRIDKACYEVAQFLHNLPGCIAEPEFTESDLWFLNDPTHSFYKRDKSKNLWVSGHFRSLIRQLFKLVPENQRADLKWDGLELPKRTPAQQAEINADVFWAVEKNSNIETLHHALANGPELNARNSDGKTAIQIAAELGKTDYVGALKEAGA